MKAYCQSCKVMVILDDPETIKLVNKTIVHRGTCEKCSALLYKRVADHEIVVDEEGNHIPLQVFIGNKTPNKFIQLKAGQKLQFVQGRKLKSGKVVEIFSDKKERNFQNLEKLKRKVKS